MRLFDHDSGVMRFLGRVTDLAILNVVSLIFCLPIFTIGEGVPSYEMSFLRIQ